LTIDIESSHRTPDTFALSGDVNSSRHTAKCVVGKNYRLQDIQLSKISRGFAPNPTRSRARPLRPRSAPAAGSLSLARTSHSTLSECRWQSAPRESEARRGRWAPAERKCRRHLPN
jgi:hypothetical protein